MPKIMPQSSDLTDMVSSCTAAEKESTGVSLQYLMLSRSNYVAWAIKMQAYMRAQGFRGPIEPADPAVAMETRKDQMALAVIYQAILDETLFLLAEKEITREAWDTLKTIYVGTDRVKEAKIQNLRTRFEVLQDEAIGDC